MCELHDETRAKKRKPGSGGKFKADGVTPRVVCWILPEDKPAAAKAAKAKHKEGTVGTRVDKGVEAISGLSLCWSIPTDEKDAEAAAAIEREATMSVEALCRCCSDM